MATDALVSVVVEDLYSIAKDRLSSMFGVEKEVDELSSTFSAIQAVLEDAERHQVTNKRVRDWLLELKEVAYEVEDILDEWVTDAFISQEDKDETRHPKRVRLSFLSPYHSFKQVKLQYDIGQRIRETTEKLNKISIKKETFNLKELYTREDMLVPNKEERETSSLIDESEIFGRDEVKEEIIRRLVGETGQKEKPISIVSIVGMGGLGKTTLAQQVCNDKRVKEYFKQPIWVCVSDPPDVNRIATKVIKSLNSSNPDILDLDDLLHDLCKAVDGKLFLLVLDDVWDESGTLWEKLRVPLRSAALGSKVVVTTRSRHVAEAMGTTLIHKLGVLSDSDCWKLFKYKALKGTEDEECRELIEIGEKIVKRCKGIPLAVRALASLLRCRRKKWYWERVLGSEIWEWDILPKNGGILPALLLSYYSLPLHLQRCFSFCSVFPKDHVIKKDKLVKLWMANGIIKSEKAKKDDIEEIGEMYFDDLLTYSLFQDAVKDNEGNMVRCKMHDLVHDLATFVSSGDYCSMEAGDSKLSSIKCHHLSLLVNRDVSSIPPSLCNVKRLHTLLLFGDSAIKAVPDTFFNPLRYLRALDLSIKFSNLPRSIGNLKHLRYLELDGSDIRDLPESVTDLCNLQTLKLNYCSKLYTLPSGMSKMVKLRHLEIEETDDLAFLPSGLGMLSSLRTLSKFPVGDEKNGGCKIGELKNLNLLRGILQIQNLEKLIINPDEAREAELDKKCHLLGLRLKCNDKTKEEWGMLGEDEMEKMERVFEGLRPPHSNLKRLAIENYAGSKFPSWLEGAKFSSLAIVYMKNCKKCRLLPGLEKFPSLERLKLVGADEIKVVGGDFYGNGNDGRGKGIAFPKLKRLSFSSMPNWEEWKLTKEDGEVMPSLDELSIEDCNKLKALPNCLPNTLRRVEIEDCSEVIWVPDNPLPLLEDLILSFDVRGILSKPLPCLPALKKLQIWDTSIESLPSDGWGLLESLNTFEIYDCDRLASLPNGLGQLKALQTLNINGCSGLSSLPEGLGQLEALQIVSVGGCSELRSLFDGFEQLKSLHRLDISFCPKLRPLPNLQHLTALEELRIYKCPLVTERLEKEKGEDWCNISHIPCIWIKGERIQ